MIFVLNVGKEDIGKCMMKLCDATTVLFNFRTIVWGYILQT